MEDFDRVLSFSYKPYDKKALEAVNKLKNHSKTKGISFSFMVLKAIIEYSKKL